MIAAVLRWIANLQPRKILQSGGVPVERSLRRAMAIRKAAARNEWSLG